MASKSNMICESQNEKIKRSRSANWEQMEKTLLKECLKEHLGIIECKTCDTNTNKSKQVAWNQVLQRFNELNNRVRSMGEIKQQRRTLKLDAKKNASDYKHSLKKTGGGMKPPSPDLNTQEIINMIPQEFVEDINEFDSDKLNSVLLIEDQKHAAQRKKTFEDENIRDNPVEQDLGIINSVIMIEDEIKITPNSDNQIPFVATKTYNIPQQNHVTSKPHALLKRTCEGKKKVQSYMKDRDIVLTNCIKEESKLKLKHLTEAHEWLRQEHELKMEQLHLKNILLQKQIKDFN